MIYIEQIRGYGIGNTVMMTPAIQFLYDILEEPVNVFFEDKNIEKMFLKWDKIRILKKPPSEKPIIHSGMINQEKPDWLHQIDIVSERFHTKPKKAYHTYVDSYTSNLQGAVVISRGMVSDKWIEHKDPQDEIYKHILNELKGEELVFIGSTKDFDRTHDRMMSWLDYQPVVIKDDMLASLAAINDCKYMITNDTGMYHVAGALDKSQFVMWKKTNLQKNLTPSRNAFISFDWENDFNIFKR